MHFFLRYLSKPMLDGILRIGTVDHSSKRSCYPFFGTVIPISTLNGWMEVNTTPQTPTKSVHDAKRCLLSINSALKYWILSIHSFLNTERGGGLAVACHLCGTWGHPVPNSLSFGLLDQNNEHEKLIHLYLCLPGDFFTSKCIWKLQVTRKCQWSYIQWQKEPWRVPFGVSQQGK